MTNLRGDADRCGAGRYVVENNRVRADSGVVANRDAAQYLRPRAHVDMTTQDRCAGPPSSDPQSHLLEEQAIRTDHCVRMDDHAVRVG